MVGAFSAKSASDLSATIWYVMGLKSAKVAGLKTDREVFDKAFDGVRCFLDSVEHKNIAQMTSGSASVYWRTATIEDAEHAHILTAMGVSARLFIGGGTLDDVRSSAEWFVSKGGNPVWEKSDPVYWYLGGICLFQCGGELWSKWDGSMRKMLIENQLKEGNALGNWNISWGAMLCALSMEVYYNYERD